MDRCPCLASQVAPEYLGSNLSIFIHQHAKFGKVLQVNLMLPTTHTGTPQVRTSVLHLWLPKVVGRPGYHLLWLWLVGRGAAWAGVYWKASHRIDYIIREAWCKMKTQESLFKNHQERWDCDSRALSYLQALLSTGPAWLHWPWAPKARPDCPGGSKVQPRLRIS